MKTALLVASACATLAGVLVKTVFGPTAQKEMATRLRRFPFVLIRMAGARLPRDCREDLTAEWRAELDHVLQDTDGMPLTRLLRGIRYSAGLLMSAPAVADGIKGESARLTRSVRIIGAGGAVAYAVWLLVHVLDSFQPVFEVVHTWNNPQPPTGHLILTNIGYLCGAAAFLGTAVLMLTGRWQIANLNTLCFAAAGVLSYLGGGPLYSIVVAAVVLAILATAVGIQIRNRRRAYHPALSRPGQ